MMPSRHVVEYDDDARTLAESLDAERALKRGIEEALNRFPLGVRASKRSERDVDRRERVIVDAAGEHPGRVRRGLEVIALIHVALRTGRSAGRMREHAFVPLGERALDRRAVSIDDVVTCSA